MNIQLTLAKRELRRNDESGAGDFHRMQLAVQAAVPEIQEAAQDRVFGGQIIVLPRIALQQAGVIGQAIEDLGGGQAVAVKLTDQIGHVVLSIRIK